MLKRKQSTGDPQVLVDLTHDQLVTQLGFVDAVDNKLGLLLSVGSGLLGILAAVLTLRQHPLSGLGIWVLALTAVAYVILAGFSTQALLDRPWGLGPEPREVEQDVVNNIPMDTIKWGLAARFNGDYEDNGDALEGKLRALRVSLGALVVETLALAIGLGLLASRP
jgi:hypothetical protein